MWWDRRIGAGQAFDRTIEDAIRAARLVLVIWSRNSVTSDWVRAEAGFALEANKLLPVLIDDAQPPLRFIHVHRIDLSDWDGSRSAVNFERLLSDIRDRLGAPASRKAEDAKPPIDESVAQTPGQPARHLNRRRILAAAGVTMILVAAVLALQFGAAGCFLFGRGAACTTGPESRIASAAPAPVRLIGEPVPFDQNKVTLSAPALSVIAKQAAFLEEHSEIMVIIEGYCTPEEGKSFGPGVLARLRANKVRDELTKHGGVAGSRIRTATVASADACTAQSGSVIVERN